MDEPHEGMHASHPRSTTQTIETMWYPPEARTRSDTSRCSCALHCCSRPSSLCSFIVSSAVCSLMPCSNVSCSRSCTARRMLAGLTHSQRSVWVD
eukprot:163206-Chlamydomonas_euryale.AAC.5